MSLYTGSDHAVNVPEMNSIDALAEAREQRDQRTIARMDRKVYLDAIIEGVRDAMADERSPIGELCDRLFDAPVRDTYDLRSVYEMHDGRGLGKALLQIIADASLDQYQDADEGF
jgi:hypothetical protein